MIAHPLAEAPGRVCLRDVTLRDGLQSEGILLDVAAKASLAGKIAAAGFRELEVASFVHPKRVPAMADAEQLWKALPPVEGIRYSALVLNRRGLDRAVQAGVVEIGVFVSASEAHSRSNSGQGTREALDEALQVSRGARQAGLRVRAGVMNAFGCHLEPAPIPLEKVMDLASALFQEGPEEIVLADTSGIGDPRQIFERVDACRRSLAGSRLSLHLHNASGWAFANLLAALEAGVDVFDVTLGGLGGCPFLPGAAGNLPAETVVRFLDAMGIDTGICPAALEAAARELRALLGR
ncbi:MAG: hydroxymethylglutaryl-CoA lyase [bacterium]